MGGSSLSCFLQAWDAVNEALTNDPDCRSLDCAIGFPPGSWQPNPWATKLGYDYIPATFHAARAADPDTPLFLTDQNVYIENNKSNLMYMLAQRLLREGVPIDGVGFQMHHPPVSTQSPPFSSFSFRSCSYDRMPSLCLHLNLLAGSADPARHRRRHSGQHGSLR